MKKRSTDNTGIQQTDGRRRHDGDNSGRYNIEENQVDKIEKEDDDS